MTLPVPQMLCFALYSATHAMQHAYQPLLDDLGLTYPQYLVLSALWEKDDQTVGQIARTLYLESNTLTPLLKRLEAQTLLTRTRDKADERQVRITLTAAGAALQARAAHIPACIFEKSGLPLDAMSDLRDQITRLRGNLLQADSRSSAQTAASATAGSGSPVSPAATGASDAIPELPIA